MIQTRAKKRASVELNELKKLRPLLYYPGNEFLEDNCMIYVKDQDQNVVKVVTVDLTQIRTKSKYFTDNSSTKKHANLPFCDIFSLQIPKVSPENVCKVLDLLKTDNKSLWKEDENLFEFFVITQFLGCDESLASRIAHMYQEIVADYDRGGKKIEKLEILNTELFARLNWSQKMYEQKEAAWSKRALKAENESNMWKSMYEDQNQFETPNNTTLLTESLNGSTLQLLNSEQNYDAIEYRKD